MYIYIVVYMYVYLHVPEGVCLFLSPDNLNHGEELLVSLVSLLFLQNQHEVVVETALHHHPVHCTGQVDVRGQKHNIFPAEGGDSLVGREEMVENVVQRSFPFARGARTGAGVRSSLAARLVDAFLSMEETRWASIAGVLARELDRLGNFFHSQVSYGSETAAATGAALHTLLASVADEVSTFALEYRRENVVETDGALEEGS